MKKVHIFILLAGSVCCLLGPVSGCGAKKAVPKAVDDGILRAAIWDSGTDFTSYDGKKAEYTGREPELLERIGGALKCTVAYLPAKREEALALLDSGQAELAVGCIPLSAALEKNYAVSVPYGAGRLYVVTGRGDFSDTPEDFLEKSTGCSGQLSEISLLRLGESVNGAKNYASLNQAAEDLLDRTIAGYFCYENEALELCRTAGLQTQSLVNVEPEQYVLAVDKSEGALMEQINLAIDEYLDQLN